MNDLFHGKEQVATDFYNVRKSVIVLYTEKEDIIVTLSEKQYEYMKENESEIDEEKILKSSGFSIKGREHGVIVEYYPNTKSAVEIKMK